SGKGWNWRKRYCCRRWKRLGIERLPKFLSRRKALIYIYRHRAINSIGDMLWHIGGVTLNWFKWIGPSTTHLSYAIESINRHDACQQRVHRCTETINVGARVRSRGVLFGRAIAR